MLDSPTNRRLSPVEASTYLKEVHGVTRSVRTLAKVRCVGGGPLFEKLGRSVFYRTGHLDAWVEANVSGAVGSTSELSVDRHCGERPGRLSEV